MTLSISTRVWRELQRIDKRLDDIQGELSELRPKPLEAPVTTDDLAATLLKIPNKFRRTYEAVVALGMASALEVSEKTGRARAVESSYLNALVLLNYLQTRKAGRLRLFGRSILVIKNAV